MRTDFVRIIVGCMTVLIISACGVKSSPIPPAGTSFPAQYPAPLPELPVKDVAPTGASQSVPVITDPKSFWQYPNTPPAQ